MGEFQRSRSKVWWSNYVEADTEDDETHNRLPGWGGAGLVLSPSRGSSSSPSSSHKSQDSGFSDSEASSTPASSGESFKPSPLPNQEPNQSVSPDQVTHEVTGLHQHCECPHQQNNECDNQSRAENTASEKQSRVQPKSPVSKLKGQFFSQCVCLDKKSQNDGPESTGNVDAQVVSTSGSPHKNVDCSTHLPVKKLREIFIQDCMCLNRTPKKHHNCVPEREDKSTTDKLTSTLRIDQQTRQKLHHISTEECARTETENISEQQQDHKEIQNKEVSSTQPECVNSAESPQDHNLQTRPPLPSLIRAVPVPTIRTPLRDQNRIHNESPNKYLQESAIASPRSLKNECQNHSQCRNDSHCSSSIPSPLRPSGEGSTHLQPQLKETNENANLSIQSLSNQGYTDLQRTPPVNQRSPKSLLNHSSGGVHTPRASSDHRESPPTKPPPSSELPENLGSPTHTSTPKTSSAATPSKLFETPNRPLRCLGLGKKHGRPVNLLNNFNSGLQPEASSSERNPVQQWLGELASLYEPECMTTLQSKSLAVDLSHQVAMMAAAATDTVKMLQESTRLISTEFAKLCQQLDYGKMEHIGPLVQSLVGLVTEFLHENCNKQEESGKVSEAKKKNLVEVCDRLRLTAAKQPPGKEQLTSEITELGNKFTSIVDNVLTQHISVLVGVLEEPTSDMALRSALTSLTTLGLEGPHLSRLVAQCSGVRALLSICLESRSSSIRTAALRALATVCCIVEAIRQLEQAGGVEILSEMLSEESRPEPEVSEAAAVLAQITAPWVEDNHNVQGLSEQLSSLVNSLTRLASTTASCETLLLSAAALANLTFMEPRTVWPLLEQRTAGKLLQAVKRRGPKVSVFLQEQAATLLANMAAVPESRSHLAEQRAVVALLCFLQIRHSPLQRAPEIAAAERVQQKSAIALSRLCSDPVVAAQVVELQGVNRLVRLCKEERERNHSDGVLVACLAALRKISANCGTKVIEDLDAMELVEPRLLDSFLIYSSRQESYV